MSTWPAWGAVSSIMWIMIQRRLSGALAAFDRSSSDQCSTISSALAISP
jgi:hypothetical protein